MSNTDPAWEEQFQREGVTTALRLEEEFSFQLTGMHETIYLRIYTRMGRAGFETEQSHYLQAPGMPIPAVTDHDRYDSVDTAVNDVLNHLLAGYQEAINAGHQPNDSWLMPSRELDRD